MREGLFVGINEYKHISKLECCVHDAKRVRSVAQPIWGLSSVRNLLDEDATKARIQDSFIELLKAPGDLCFFFYSGHGSTVRDTSGDEKDKRDEAICPVDTTDNESLIVDDWVASTILAELPENKRLVLVFDSCHAGSMAKNPGMTVKRVCFSEPSISSDSSVKTEPRRIRSSFLRVFEKLYKKSGKKLTALYACRPYQLSYEGNVNGETGGFFSWHLCKVLKENTCRSYKQLIKAVKKSFGEHSKEQTPYAAGDIRRRIGE